MVAWTDSNGAHYVNEYDDTGRVIYQGGHDGVWASSFNYQENPDGTGTTTVHTDAVGAHRVYGFDNDLRPRAVADPAGRIVRTDFNADRDPLQITDPTGATTTLRYTPTACRRRSPTRSDRSRPSGTSTRRPGRAQQR